MKVKLSLDASPSVTRPMFRKSTGVAMVAFEPVMLTAKELVLTASVLAVRLPRIDTEPAGPATGCRPSVSRPLASPVKVTETAEFSFRLLPAPLRVLPKVMAPEVPSTSELPARVAGPLKVIAPPPWAR